MTNLKIIDPVKGIREKRHAYFHNGIVSLEDMIGRVSSDILAIPHARMLVFRIEDWCIIGSTHAWIPVSDDRSVPDLFFQVVPTPEREFRSMRSDVFLTAVSRDLALLVPQFHLVVQGVVTDNLLSEVYPMTFCQQMVAFRFLPEYQSLSTQLAEQE